MSLLPPPDHLAALSARSRAYADWFQLPLKNRAWRGNSGDFMGSGVGSSLDFQDHRSYLPGDDPRHINWQAFARTGNYSMKLYREEVRPVIELIFDVSDSLFFDPLKVNRTLEICYFCHYATIVAGAASHVHLVKGNQQLPISAEAMHTHDWLRQAAELHPTMAAAAPNLNPLPFRAQSLRIFVSDLLFPVNPEAVISELTRNKGGAIIFCPFLQSEANPNWEGNYEFVDAEAGTHHDHRVDQALLKRYLKAYQTHFESWKRACQKFGVTLARVPCEPEFNDAIQLEAIPSGAVMI